MARRLIALAATGLIGLSLAGCVSQDKYNALKIEKDQLAEQLGSAESAAASAKASADSWKAQLDRLIAAGNDQAGLAASLLKENGEYKARVAELQAKYDAALAGQQQFVVNNLPSALPAQETKELEEFARQHPELVEFDAARGILRFKSDVTFAKGSAELTPNARQAIGQLASLLNGGIFTKYEFLVAGHTDSQPVSNPATIAAGHKDNWYLSAHRSISVGSALSRDGISPRRLGVLGYADQRPIASNTTSEGMAKNRRVEIVVLPITYHGGTTVVDVPAPTHNVGRTTRVVTPVKRPGAGELNKDSAFNDTRPIVGNK
jgi:chemotaxis protein MotB